MVTLAEEGRLGEAVDEALRSRDPQVRERRRQIARENTWDLRVEQILGLLREAREGRRQ